MATARQSWSNTAPLNPTKLITNAVASNPASTTARQAQTRIYHGSEESLIIATADVIRKGDDISISIPNSLRTPVSRHYYYGTPL
jgi:hypothetical protein